MAGGGRHTGWHRNLQLLEDGTLAGESTLQLSCRNGEDLLGLNRGWLHLGLRLNLLLSG